MPSVSDHTRRDAEHAARSMIRVSVMPYVRRMDEQAKADIAEAIAAAEASGEPVDGKAIGLAAADRAVALYISPGVPEPAVEGSLQDELAAAPEDS